MAEHNNIGQRGEENAVNYLLSNGYDILERNYRFGRAEIDIIVQKDKTLIFVEVKTRKNSDFGFPETFVSESQEERIHLAAEEFVEKHGWQGDIRFDIIAIVWDLSEPTFDHFEDAF